MGDSGRDLRHDARHKRLQLGSQLRHQGLDKGHQSRRQGRQDIPERRQQVSDQERSHGRGQTVQRRLEILPQHQRSHDIRGGGLHGCQATAERCGGLVCRGPGDAQVVLDDLDGLDDFIKWHILDSLRSYFNSIAQDPAVIDEPGHFRLSASVAQLKVIQHRKIIFCKALVGPLYAGDVGAHLVGVIGHLHDGFVGIFCGCGGISA